jgi:transposase
MPQTNDLSRCLTALDQDSTLIAVIEMSQSSWLVAGIVPGIERHPTKKLEPNEVELLRLLQRWRVEMPVWSAASAILANKALAAGLPGPPLPGTLAHLFSGALR